MRLFFFWDGLEHRHGSSQKGTCSAALSFGSTFASAATRIVAFGELNMNVLSYSSAFTLRARIAHIEGPTRESAIACATLPETVVYAAA
jgi:hypothetical protein